MQGFEEFDDWDLEEVVEDKPIETSGGNKFSNYSQSPSLENSQKSAWSPPKPSGKLFDKNKSPAGSGAFPEFGKPAAKQASFDDDEFWRTPSLGQVKPPAQPEPPKKAPPAAVS